MAILARVQEPLQLVAVDDGGPRLCRTGGPIVGMAWSAVGGVGRALGCSEACVSHAVEGRALPMSRYMPGRYPLMAYQPAGSSRGVGRQASAAAVMLMSASATATARGMAATRRTGRGRLRGQVCPSSAQDHRAISVQLARVTSGPSRTFQVATTCSSEA
jgi:hypothetical protein